MEKVIEMIEAAARRALGAYAVGLTGDVTVPIVPGTFLHGRAIDASLEANTCPLPLVMLFDPVTDTATTTAKVTRANITLWFADAKPGQGDDPEAEAAAVVRMDALKRGFLAALDASPVVEITNMRATPFHDAYAARLTGVGVQFTLGVPAGSLAAACV